VIITLLNRTRSFAKKIQLHV